MSKKLLPEIWYNGTKYDLPQGEPGKDGKDGKDGQSFVGERGPAGQDGTNGTNGAKGDPFTYDDFTPEQLQNLVGPAGPVGPKGSKGDKGDQGEKGDTVLIGNEETYTLYNTVGNNTDGAMTQNATTGAIESNKGVIYIKYWAEQSYSGTAPNLMYEGNPKGASNIQNGEYWYLPIDAEHYATVNNVNYSPDTLWKASKVIENGLTVTIWTEVPIRNDVIYIHNTTDTNSNQIAYVHKNNGLEPLQSEYNQNYREATAGSSNAIQFAWRNLPGKKTYKIHLIVPYSIEVVSSDTNYYVFDIRKRFNSGSEATYIEKIPYRTKSTDIRSYDTEGWLSGVRPKSEYIISLEEDGVIALTIKAVEGTSISAWLEESDVDGTIELKYNTNEAEWSENVITGDWEEGDIIRVIPHQLSWAARQLNDSKTYFGIRNRSIGSNFEIAARANNSTASRDSNDPWPYSDFVELGTQSASARDGFRLRPYYDFIMGSGTKAIDINASFLTGQTLKFSYKKMTNVLKDTLLMHTVPAHLNSMNETYTTHRYAVSKGTYIVRCSSWGARAGLFNDIAIYCYAAKGSSSAIRTIAYNELTPGYHQDYKIEIQSDTVEIAVSHANATDFVYVGRLQEKDLRKPLKGKTVSFIGDSITTFKGTHPYTTSNSYPYSYPQSVRNVVSVSQTWWYQLMDKLGLRLMNNCSWSGSTVTSSAASGWSSVSANASAACSYRRIGDLKYNSSKDPDIVIINIGINDFTRDTTQYGSNAVTLGTWNGTTELQIEANKPLLDFSKAYGLMLSRIMEQYPNTEVYCCTLIEAGTMTKINESSDINRLDYSKGFPCTRGGEDNTSLTEWNERIRKIAHALGANVIDLHSCGITYWTMETDYSGIVDSPDELHPNSNGTYKMACKAAAEIMAKSRYVFE